MKFCSECGSAGTMRIPKGDNRHRFICDGCGRIHYRNPRIIAGCIALWDGKILLCKRAIEPRKGWWTIPGGFLEQGEVAEVGAARETLEEACATVEISSLHTMYSIPHISQVYLVFLANLVDGSYGAGVESEEVKLVSVDEIPWDEIAFSAVKFSLEKYIERLKTNVETTYCGYYDKPFGT